jgi:ferredoxin--NADP+ reductase/benzoate/toluate 1,2-dioxygenase reductase subunit
MIDVSQRGHDLGPALPARPAGPRAAHSHRVLGVRHVSASAFVLRITRENLSFQPGQWINLGLPRRREQREYSIYSAVSDDFLEVLVKEIPGGALSPLLRRLKESDVVEVDGPHGSFTLVEGGREPPRLLFCATGTGVSPFHCMVRSFPGLDYRLLHGVRSIVELYDHPSFDNARAVPCLSAGTAGPGRHAGRLTDWLRKNPVDNSSYCYLCGNSDMIYEAYGILSSYGIPRSRIFAEVYF